MSTHIACAMTVFAVLVGCAEGAVGDVLPRGADAGGRDAAARGSRADDASSPDAAPAGDPLEGIGAATQVLATTDWTDLPTWRDGALVLQRARERMEALEGGATRPAPGAACRGLDREGFTYCLERTSGGGVVLSRVRGAVREELARADTARVPGLANDWAVRSDGIVYFSNRCDEHATCASAPAGVVGGIYVYRDGGISAAHVGLPNPNGIALSPDGATLYVAAAAYQRREEAALHRFAVAADGSLGEPERVAPVPTPDGACVDRAGNVFVASDASSVLALAPDGRVLGRVRAAGRVTSVTLGGAEGRTLFMTTDASGVFAVDLAP